MELCLTPAPVARMARDLAKGAGASRPDGARFRAWRREMEGAGPAPDDQAHDPAAFFAALPAGYTGTLLRVGLEPATDPTRAKP